MQSSIVNVASTAAGLDVAAEVVNPAAVISPTSTVPIEEEEDALNPPVPPVSIAPPPVHEDASASATIGTIVGAAAGGVALIVVVVAVGIAISRRGKTTSTTTADECGEGGLQNASAAAEGNEAAQLGCGGETCCMKVSQS